MFHAGGHNIDPGGVDAAVSQDVGQLGDILLNAIKSAGKQFSQVVRKHLGFFYPRSFTKLFHLVPDTAAVKMLSVLANEDRARRDILLLGIMQQQFSQLTRNEDRPGFAFAV